MVSSQLLPAPLLKALEPLTEWYSTRLPREKYLILSAVGIALFMGLYTVFEGVIASFDEQSQKLTELNETLRTVPPLLNQFNRLETRRRSSEQKFSRAGAPSQLLAHLEGVIKRKAQVQSRFQIKKGSEADLSESFIRVPFTVVFQQITPAELSDFLKEVSGDEERPAIVSKLSLTSRGTTIRAEVSLDLVARRA